MYYINYSETFQILLLVFWLIGHIRRHFFCEGLRG